MNYPSDSTPRPRSGFTIVELLIVMAIIVLLAAVTLPTIKGMLDGQKVSEAARIVRTYVESAKARAIATGRPVALILDRTRYDGSGGLIPNNTCIRLSVGDVFPAYTGDWAGAKGSLASSGGAADSILIPFAEAASLVESAGLVQAGDLIEIGGRREKFSIKTPPSFEDINSKRYVRVSFYNPPLASGWFMQEPAPLPIGSNSDPDLNPKLTFRIYRKPNKSLAGGVSLPRGTCIDMTVSGFGVGGRQLSSDALHLTSFPNPPADPPPPLPGNFGPVYLVFSPSGQVEAWYYESRVLPVHSLTRDYPSGLIHLLIGATDQVVGTAFGTDQDGDRNEETMINATEDFMPNIMDTGNSWVTINPYTGGITTSSVQATTVGPALRTPPPPAPQERLQHRIAQARLLATNALSEITQ